MLNKNKKGFSFIEMILGLMFVVLFMTVVVVMASDTKDVKIKSSIEKNECAVNCIVAVKDSKK